MFNFLSNHYNVRIYTSLNTRQNLCEGHVLRTNTSRIIQTFEHSNQIFARPPRGGGGLDQKEEEMMGDIAKRWKELSGKTKWKDLLVPLDLDLRRYILHYGDMAEVGYVAFNSDRRSKYVGDSCYTKEELFARTGYLKANPFR